MKSPLKEPARIGERVPARYYAVLLLSVLVLYAAYLWLARNAQPWYENTEYVMWHYNMQRMGGQGEEPLRLLAIGDSTLKAGLIPTRLGDRVENLALGGSTPIVGYLTLRTFLEHNPPPQKLVLSYTPHHLMAQDAFWERAVRYRYARPGDYREVLQEAEQLKDPVLGENLLWKYRWNPATYASPILRGWRQQRHRKFDGEYAQLAEDRGHHYFGTGERAHRGNAETRYDAYRTSPLLDRYMRRLVTLALEHGIETYWMTQPMPELSCNMLAGGFQADFARWLQELAALGITVDAGIPCWDNALYGDAAHLYRGSPRFTDLIGDFVGL